MTVKNAMVVKAFGSHHKTYVVLQVFCGIFFVIFCCSFPFFLIYKICANALKDKNGKTFDIDGRSVHLESHVFTRLVTRHSNHVHCPYKTLYKGYEHEFRYYKLFQIFLHFLLLLPITSTTNVGNRTGWMFAFTTITLILTLYCVFATSRASSWILLTMRSSL